MSFRFFFQPIALSADEWKGGPTGKCNATGGTIRDVVFENVTAQAENGIFVSGRVGGVSDVSFKNVNLLIQQKPPNNASVDRSTLALSNM